MITDKFQYEARHIAPNIDTHTSPNNSLIYKNLNNGILKNYRKVDRDTSYKEVL